LSKPLGPVNSSPCSFACGSTAQPAAMIQSPIATETSASGMAVIPATLTLGGGCQINGGSDLGIG
jgi:hypothetical protein